MSIRRDPHIVPTCCLALGLAWITAGSSTLAGHIRIESLALRGGVSGSSPIGEEQRVYFQQADIAVTARLPWEWEVGSGWMLGSRLLGSAGILRGGDETNGLVTLVPLDLAFGRKDGLFAIDIGGGGALLSDHTFARQHLGRAFQFVWTFGATSRLPGPLGVGYHFQHYSDAALYGSDSRGVGRTSSNSSIGSGPRSRDLAGTDYSRSPITGKPACPLYLASSLMKTAGRELV